MMSLLRNEVRCSHCGSTNVVGYSRVVGYFSVINNWNKGKVAEFDDRQKGNYSLNNHFGGKDENKKD